MARQFDIFVAKRVALIIVLIFSMVEAAPSVPTCPSNGGIQLPSQDQEGVRGVKRSLADAISATLTQSPNRHEIQQADPPLTEPVTKDLGEQSSLRSLTYPSGPILKNQEALGLGHTSASSKGLGRVYKEEHQEGDSREKANTKLQEKVAAQKEDYLKEKNEKEDKIKQTTGLNESGENKERTESDNDDGGHHKIGHRTKGQHNIHKKNEYHKKFVFYDEHHEGGENKNQDGLHKDLENLGGKKFKKGLHNSKQKTAQKSAGGGHKKAKKNKHITGHLFKKGKGAKHGDEKKYRKKGSLAAKKNMRKRHSISSRVEGQPLCK